MLAPPDTDASLPQLRTCPAVSLPITPAALDAVHLAPDNQVPHRAAVYFTEQSDRRSGRDIQPADYMVATVKGPL